MRAAIAAVALVAAVTASVPTATTATAAPGGTTAKRARPKPKPKRPVKRTPYQAYVAFTKMYAADITGPGLAANIPTEDQIHIAKLGNPIAGVTFYYADGGHFDDTPREVYVSMLLADVDGRVLQAFAPMQWAASNRWRAVACTEKYLPAQRALEKTGYTEQGLRDMETAHCVDLTPRFAALFTADTTAADLDGLFALLVMIHDGEPGLTILRDDQSLGGLPVTWAKPKAKITPPALRRDADGTLHASGFVSTLDHVWRLTLRVHGDDIELDRQSVAAITISIP